MYACAINRLFSIAIFPGRGFGESEVDVSFWTSQTSVSCFSQAPLWTPGETIKMKHSDRRLYHRISTAESRSAQLFYQYCRHNPKCLDERQC